VSSPTFSLVHEYRGGTVTLYHADLYRLSATDAEALGLEDERVSRGVLVIEWPDRLTHPIAGATRIEIQVVGDTRRLLTTTIPSGSSAPLS
jgi:tRNA threonylcarbamoyladenosine biosynthesis protein TsaE